MNCPKCQCTQIIKYGHTHYGKPRFKCRACGRQFVEEATQQPIDQVTRQLIDKLLLERLALAAIARVTGGSERWLQLYVNQKFYQTPKTIEVTPKNPVLQSLFSVNRYLSLRRKLLLHIEPLQSQILWYRNVA
jgi:AraC-like DNA-binding protein